MLFLACLFISPLAGSVPAYATAPALFYVACLMMRELVDLDWDDKTEVLPACVTALMMPVHLFHRQRCLVRLRLLRRLEGADRAARPA